MTALFRYKPLMWILAALATVVCAFPLSGSEDHRAEIYHVVICWLKEPDNEQQRQKLIDEAQSMKEIEGVLAVEVGTMLPSNREIVDSSFDIGIIMSFKDRRTMHAYLSDPAHQRATREILAPLTKKVVVYDFVSVE